MTTRASRFGGIVGFIGIVCFVIWIWQTYHDEIFVGRLSVEARQTLLRLQRQLPIEIEQGVFLDRYDINHDKVSFTFRVEFINYAELGQDRTKKQIEVNAHRWICGWRESLPKEAGRLIVNITIIDLNEVQIASISNQSRDCNEYHLAPIPEELI